MEKFFEEPELTVLKFDTEETMLMELSIIIPSEEDEGDVRLPGVDFGS